MMLRALFLTFILSASASAEVVQGTVLEDHSGAPMLAASIKLKTISGTTLKEMDTDRTGSFVIPDVPAGEYQVTVTKSNYASVNARIMAQRDGAAPSVFRLIKYGVISGRVTSPRMGATVVAIEQVPGGHDGRKRRVSNFRYSAGSVSPSPTALRRYEPRAVTRVGAVPEQHAAAGVCDNWG
jgi:hypothetical protein